MSHKLIRLRRIRVLFAVVLYFWHAAYAQPPNQMPEVGSDLQINDWVQAIWQIRKSKKWNDPLTQQEMSSVRFGMDAFDYMLLQDSTWASKEVLKVITLQLTGNIEELRGVETRVTTSLDLKAYFDAASRKIVIPVGLLSAMYWTQWAKQEAKENPNLQPYLAEYLYRLSRNNFQRTSTTASTVIRLSEYVNGVPWRPDNATTNKTETVVRKAMLDSITFIVGHEACHAALRHKPANDARTSVLQEWRADDCSRKMIEGWHPGQSDPFLVLQVLSLNALDDKKNPVISNSHPSAICRMLYQIETFADANTANAGALSFFSEVLNIPSISALEKKAQFDIEALAELKHTCGLI